MSSAMIYDSNFNMMLEMNYKYNIFRFIELNFICCGYVIVTYIVKIILYYILHTKYYFTLLKTFKHYSIRSII